jgi:hypothetical protein
MNDFTTAYKNYMRLKIPHTNECARTFLAHDTEQIGLFVNALQEVRNVEDIKVSEPNDFGIVSVCYRPCGIIASLVCRAICQSFC